MNAIARISLFHRLWIVGLAIVLTGCGGSGGRQAVDAATACGPADATTSADCGSVVVALTDVEGDFSSYTVDVHSITLERANGTSIEMLPQTARVDFAQLTTLSELVSRSNVVPGEFVGGRIRIDYSDAEIFVESGDALVPADVYDSDGLLLTDGSADSIVDVEISLPASERLIVGQSRTALLSIDFDLTASHVVDTSTTPVTVVAQPYLVAEVEPVDRKETRARGALVDVDLDAGTYDIRLRPWLHRAGDWGDFTVATTSETEFEVQGQTLVGRPGLEALAGQPAGTLTVAFGTLDLGNRRFTADVVHAGDSVGGDRYSAVLGNVVSRTGDQLVIKGAVAIRRDRRAHFHRTVIVDIGPDTKISKVGDPDGTFDKDDLSVGQRTMVFGQFTNPGIDSAGADVALMLDATAGRARLLRTRLSGAVNRILPGQVDIELRAIDRLSVALFDFSGTGVGEDADPAHYEVATSTLPLDALEESRPVRVIGFVTPFGEAPPDFEGRVLIGPRDVPAVLGAGWGIDGTAAPFSVMGSSSLVIDLMNPDIGTRHHILIGDRLIDLFDLPASPAIAESDSPRVYGIWEPGHVELFKSFADFVDELALRLASADRARSLSAYGNFSEDGNELTANKIVVHMLPADGR